MSLSSLSIWSIFLAEWVRGVFLSNFYFLHFYQSTPSWRKVMGWNEQSAMWWVAHVILVSAQGPNPYFFFFGGLLVDLGPVWTKAWTRTWTRAWQFSITGRGGLPHSTLFYYLLYDIKATIFSQIWGFIYGVFPLNLICILEKLNNFE